MNEIRLAHAVSVLLNSDKPITRIALDNGFPNLVAFNRVFNETHQLKPAEYRKRMSSIAEEKAEPTRESNNQEKNEVMSELREYLKSTPVVTSQYKLENR